MIYEIQLINIHKRNLELLEKQKAQLGEYISVHIHNQIEATAKEISDLERALRRRLQSLMEKAAIYGLNSPPEVSIEIEDIQAYFKESKVENSGKVNLGQVIGEGIHSGLRRFCSSEESNKAWFAIKNMPTKEWDNVCQIVAEEIVKLMKEGK